MRYRREERFGPFVDTARKRANALRAQQRQRNALPLLAAIIAETQPSIDDVMVQRGERAAIWEQDQRDWHARCWREGRRALAALPGDMRARALAYWNGHRWLPANGGYLLDMVHSIERGKLVPDALSGFRFAGSMSTADHLALIEARRASLPAGLPLDR